MANFIGMVFATLKKEGIDTSNMDINDAIAKYNELKGGNGGDKSKGEETPKETQKQQAQLKKDNADKNNTQYERRTSYEDSQEIDWDLAEKNEKINGNNAKNPTRKDKYGNALVSDEAFDVGVEAGKSYLDYMLKYYDKNQLKRSNVFLGGMQDVVGNAITNNGFDPNQDVTYQDFNEIIGSIIGEEVDYQSYESNKSNGFTGRKYIGYSGTNNSKQGQITRSNKPRQ